MTFNKFFLVFDKLGRFIEKKQFNYEELDEARLYIRQQTRRGMRVEETLNYTVYEKY